MSCTADNQATPQHKELSDDIGIINSSLVGYHGPSAPSFSAARSTTGQDSKIVEEDSLITARQTNPLPPQSPSNVTMEGTAPAQFGTTSATQQPDRFGQPSPVTIETAQKPHEHPLDWTEDLTPSWYPEYSATEPEICLWASTPWHIQERHWIKAASADDDALYDTVRVASVLRRAESTLYEVPTNVGLRYPQFSRGYSSWSRSLGPCEVFPEGSRGLKTLEEGQTLADIQHGARYMAAGKYFVPAPSKLHQMMTIEDFEIEKTPSKTGHGRTFSVKGGFRPPPLALNHPSAPQPPTTPWVPEPDCEADMEDIPLVSPSSVPESLPPSSPPSSPPCVDSDDYRDYHGPINKFPGEVSDDSEVSLYSNDMDPFLDLGSSDHVELDLSHEGDDGHDPFNEDFEVDLMDLWSAATHARLKPANKEQLKDLVDSSRDSCDHTLFAMDKSEALPDLPPGYRWTAHSFALHHPGPRLIVYAPPSDEYEFDDDNISCIGSDGTSEFTSSPVKMMQSGRAAVWSVPIPEQEEPEDDEPLKTLYEGYLDEHDFKIDLGVLEPESFDFWMQPVTSVLSLMGYLRELFQPIAPDL